MDIEPVRRELARLRTLLQDADDDLIDYLRAVTHFALLELPQCVGVSVTVVDGTTPYTVTATSPEIRVVDASQYVDDGPCVATSWTGVPSDLPDVLDEARWHFYACAAAAQGVKSSLSLPLLFEGETIGALNFYGSTADAFDDRAHLLAEVISGHAALAIRNADLSLRTAGFAAETTCRTRDDADATEDEAVGIVMELRQVQAQKARQSLHQAAAAAGIDLHTLASALVTLRRTEPGPAS